MRRRSSHGILDQDFLAEFATGINQMLFEVLNARVQLSKMVNVLKLIESDENCTGYKRARGSHAFEHVQGVE